MAGRHSGARGQFTKQPSAPACWASPGQSAWSTLCCAASCESNSTCWPDCEKCPEMAAHPQWLLSKFQSDWPQEWQAIVHANNHAAPMWLRINRSRPDHAEVPDSLRESGFSVASHPSAPDAIRITPAAAVNAIPGFLQGSFSVQDPAAQLAVDLLDLKRRAACARCLRRARWQNLPYPGAIPGDRLTAVDQANPACDDPVKTSTALAYGQRAQPGVGRCGTIPQTGGMEFRSSASCWMRPARPPA